jgi:predicted lipid-binding transport protein (Tim44 family)
MQQRTVMETRGFGWPERILAGLLGAGLLALGLIFGVVILGLGAAAATVIGARVWWLRRRQRRAGTAPGASVIEGEYRVVTRQRQQRDSDADSDT